MDWLEEQQAARLRENAAKQARRDALAHARKQLEKNPEYPSIVVEINDADQEIRKSRPQEAGVLRSETRLEYLLRVLDAHGKAYLRLAVDLDSVKALETIMDDLACKMWYQFSGLQPEDIPPIEPFVTPQLAQFHRAKIFDRARHWVVEGYRILATPERERDQSQPSLQTITEQKTARISQQIKELREECRMTEEQLAEAVNLSVRNVRRHERGQTRIIRANNIRAYEEVFSKRLKRKISLTSGYDSATD